MKTRILFIHATREESPEYNVHRTLAEHVDPDQVESYFIWQDHTHDRSKNHPAQLRDLNHNFFYDFGRNLSLVPMPNRLHRGGMMLRRLPGALAFLNSKVRQIKPDIIYTSQQNHDVQLARIISAIFRTPYILHIHYPVPWLDKGTIQAILKTTRLIAVSEFIRNSAISSGVPAEHIHTLLNTIDIRQFDRPKDRKTIRAEFGWRIDTPIVTAIGRLDPSKGHLHLIDAFAKVQQHLPEAQLLICGTSIMRNSYESVLRSRVAELNIESHVTFAGVRNDIPVILAGTDVFCLPTENDACPLVFLEAMTAEVPTVACYSGGVPELVKHQETGLLSQIGDADTLSSNILKLLCDQELACKFGVAGKKRVLSAFTPDKVAAKWSTLVARLLNT